jgi:hypothetical protein
VTAAALLDGVMPHWHFRERHHIHIAATRGAVWSAVNAVRGDEIALARALFAVRRLPARLLGTAPPKPASRPILEEMLKGGFTLLARDLEREVVLGAVGRFWTIAPCPLQIADLADFRAPHPGCAHAAMDMRILDAPRGGVTLTTETRILVPERGARVRFALYWSLVRGGSALLRRTWLHAIRRRAVDTPGAAS